MDPNRRRSLPQSFPSSSHPSNNTSSYSPSSSLPSSRRHTFPTPNLYNSVPPTAQQAALRHMMNQGTINPHTIIPSPHSYQAPHAPYLYTIPLPPQTSVFSPETHPFLDYNSPNGVDNLDLDLNTSPAQLWQQMRDGISPLSKYMDQPATRPGVPSMSIVHPQLPWSITIHPSGFCGRSVAVADVIQTVLKMVQSILTENDIAAMNDPRPPLGWVGSRRLDLLNGRTRLVGFRKLPDGGEIWEMIIL